MPSHVWVKWLRVQLSHGRPGAVKTIAARRRAPSSRRLVDVDAAIEDLLPRLRRSIRGSVAADLGTRALYASDASNYRVVPAAVVAPATTEELATVVGMAADAGVPITMRGAGTSIAGNAL